MNAPAQCTCNICNGILQFDQAHSGQTTACPHCGMETVLFIPYKEEAAVIVADPEPTPLPLSSGEEEPLFYNSGIAVTRTRVIIGTQIIAMSHVSSVRLDEISPGMLGGILILVLGAIFLIGGFVSEASEAILVGAFIVLLGFVAAATQKTIYRVMLCTSGGEVTGAETKDRAFATCLIEAINNAMVARG